MSDAALQWTDFGLIPAQINVSKMQIRTLPSNGYPLGRTGTLTGWLSSHNTLGLSQKNAVVLLECWMQSNLKR